MRRWLEGTRPTPKGAIERLNAWAYALDQTAQAIIMRTGAPAALLVYRRDQDVPPWTGLRTAGCHLAMVRRVFERRPDIQLITFDRATYRYWLGARADSEEMRSVWAASRVEGDRRNLCAGARPTAIELPARSSKKPEDSRISQPPSPCRRAEPRVVAREPAGQEQDGHCSATSPRHGRAHRFNLV